MAKPLPYGRHAVEQSDIDAVEECLRSPNLTQGPRVGEFEAALASATGASHACAVSSGTAALHLAVLALGLGPGDTAIVPAITFVATANAVRLARARVAFADVDPTTALIDLESLSAVAERVVQEGGRVALVIPVDMTGQPADRQAIKAIAEGHGARVLADAAHSLGATFQVAGRERSVADPEYVDAAVLSFHPVKHVTTGEGGAVVTGDADLAASVRHLCNHGIHKDVSRYRVDLDPSLIGPWYYEQDEVGLNYRLPDVLCALGAAQLRRLPALVQRRRDLARRYDEALESDDALRATMEPARQLGDRRSSYHLYVVRLKRCPEAGFLRAAEARADLYRFLRDHEIYTQIHYVPVPWQPAQRDALHPPTGYPGAEAWYASCLSLPLFPSMANDDVDRVVDALKRFAAGRLAAA